jgi:hypothetical protein
MQAKRSLEHIVSLLHAVNETLVVAHDLAGDAKQDKTLAEIVDVSNAVIRLVASCKARIIEIRNEARS